MCVCVTVGAIQCKKIENINLIFNVTIFAFIRYRKYVSEENMDIT